MWFLFSALSHLVHAVKQFLTALEVIFKLGSAMGKSRMFIGYDVTSNLPGDGNCFYALAAKALGIETQSLMKVVFDFLRSHQFVMSNLAYRLLSNDKAKFGCVKWQQFLPELSASLRNSKQLHMLKTLC